MKRKPSEIFRIIMFIAGLILVTIGELSQSTSTTIAGAVFVYIALHE